MAILRFSIRMFAVLALGVLLGSDVAAAQNASTTGQIRGRVQSDAGVPLAAVVVTARNVETGLERSTQTTEDGLYAIQLLPPGTYSVSARAIGYQPGSAPAVRVRVGSASPANFTLGQAAVALEAITVTGEVQIDVAEGGVRQLVTQEEIEQLPSLGRDFVDFINLSGLVAPDPGETTGGQFSIAGQRASQTSLQIDGADANNSFFGENRGGSRIPFNFSLESIREFEIITNGFDVEYHDFTGGIINVVTRGGTNDFEGTLYGNYRSDALTSSSFIVDPSNPEITTDYSVQQFAGRISGPLKQDKAFFLLSIDGQRRREPQLPLTRSRFAPGSADEDAVVFDEMGRYFQILENQYGVANAAAGYEPFQTSNDAISIFGRVDWSISNAHRLSLRHNFSTFTNDQEWDGNFDFAYGRSRAEEFSDRSHSTVAELQSVLSDNMYNVLRFQYSDETRPRQGNDLRPTLTVNLSNSNTVRYGGSFASFNNRLDESKIELINNLTRVMGAHTFKVGARLLRSSYFNRFMNFGSAFQGAGEYVFSNLDDFENFQPSSYFRPIQEGGGVPTSEFSVIDWGIYLQDSWQVSPKLTATIGVRYDQKSFRDSPQPVAGVEQAFGFTTGFAPTDNNNFSPRLALAYDVHGNGRSVLRGGMGFLYGPLPGVVGGNVLQTERPVLEVICNGSIADGDLDAPPSPADYRTWDISGLGADGTPEAPIACAGAAAGGVPTFTFWTSDFQMPEVFKANLGYETLIGERTSFGVNLLYSQTWNLYTVRNLNLRDSQFQLAGEANRRVFSPMGVFDPSTANSTGSRRNLEYGDVLVNFSDGRARSIVAEFRGSRRFGDGLSLNASYTYIKAYDNSPYSCCTAGGGYADPTTGVFGPNEIGGFGDSDRAWGISDFAREHAIVVSAFARLPLGIDFAAFWKSQSGRPWTVVGDDDLNGDGITGNDRTFVHAPANLPLASTGDAAVAERALYTQLLADNPCVGDYQGRIVERNTCRMPWRHDMNIRLTRSFGTVSGQRAEIQVDFFNVLNGLGRLFCDESAADVDLTSGVCGLGRVTGVFGSDQELLDPRGFDAATGEILYAVNSNFGEEDLLGANLVLQFQMQLGFRYFF